MKKFLFNQVIGLKHAPANVLKMNFFIYCKIVKPVKNTSKEAKLLVKLLVYSLKYTTNQRTPSVFENSTNLLKILVSPKKQTPSYSAYDCTHTVIRISENG